MAATGGLAILVDEKRVNELLQQKSGIKALLRSAFNTILFVCFLLLFTSLALSEPRNKMRAFEGFLRKRFDEASPVRLEEVQSVDGFWRYFNESFKPAIYGEDTARYFFPGAVVPTWLQVLGPNYMYGMGRMRILNILPDSDCRVAEQYRSYFPTCYGPFNLDAVDREPFGPPNDEGVPTYQFSADANGENYEGWLASYPPGGYVEMLTPDYPKTNDKFLAMKQNGFISEKTRAIFLELTIYNFNLGLYGVMRITFELAPAGDWIQNFDIDVLLQRHLQPLGAGSTEDWLFLILEAGLVLFVLRYVLEEAAEFVGFQSKNGKISVTIKWDYFLDAWNVLDWFNLIMMIITVCYKVDTWSKAGGLYVISPSNWDSVTKDMYSNFHGVASNVRQIQSLISFNTILTWFKAVKYINIIPYVTTFMQTVVISQQNLVSWIIVFMSVLVGFVLAFSTAFGGDVTALRTPFQAFKFIMLTVLGNSDVSVIYDVSPVLGSLLIIMFLVSIFFIIMNLFYAIVVSTLSDAKIEEDAKQKKKWAVLSDRLSETWKAMNRGGQLEKQIRGCVPGLYSRMLKRYKRLEERELARDESVRKKQLQIVLSDTSQKLGPANPVWGRRTKRQLATVQIEDKIETDSEESEPDLGPLRSLGQIRQKSGMEDAFGDSAMGATFESFATPLDGDGTTADADITDEGVELVLDASQHIARGIVDRTRGPPGGSFGRNDGVYGSAEQCIDGVGSLG